VLHDASDTIITDRLLRQLEDNYVLEMISMSEVSLAAARARKKEEEQQSGQQLQFANSSNISISPSPSPAKAASRTPSAEYPPGTSTSAARSSSQDSKGKDSERATAAGILDTVLATANGVLEKGMSLVTPADPPKPTLGGLTGREATNWLLRYGAILSEEMALDMLRVRDELCSLEQRTELDKQQLQQKILHSCEAVRSSEGDLAEADRLMLRFMERIEDLDERLKHTIATAETLSRAVLGVGVEVELDPETSDDDEDDTAVAKLTAIAAKNRLARISEELDEENNSRANSTLDSPISMLRGFIANDDDDMYLDGGGGRVSTSSDGTAASVGTSRSEVSGGSGGEGASTGNNSNNNYEITSLSPLKPGNKPLDESDYEIKITHAKTEDPQRSVVYFAGDHESPPAASPRTRRRDYLRASFNSFFGSEATAGAASASASGKESGGASSTKESGSSNSSTKSKKEGNLGSSSPTIATEAAAPLPATPPATSPSPRKSTGYRAAAIAHLGSVFTAITTAGGLLGSSKKKTPEELEEEARLDRASKAEAEMQRVSDESQRCQQRIISTTRALNKAKQRLVQTTQWKAAALLAQDEAVHWKAALCDQLQRLVQDANTKRSERLQYITNTYFF